VFFELLLQLSGGTMTVDRITNYLVASIVLILSMSETFKGILMVFSNQNPILFIAKVGFLVFCILPEPRRKENYQHALGIYTKRKWLYGLFAIIGGAWGIFLAYVIVLNA
jgi:hypothetical protein